MQRMCIAYALHGSRLHDRPPCTRAMSFLDPYSSNRRVPLVWIGRLVLLALVAGLAALGWWAFGG